MARHNTELDNKLRDLSINDWELFCAVLGPDALTRAKVILLRQAGKTYQQISIQLSISSRQVEYICQNNSIQIFVSSNT